ncbi:30S ribosomal protein S2 [Candidatus Desantisbacteria bacterium CG_4_10_14_0_8_um_filter_48_22]|uniref:Small ribosomal subunit protein uS2 n=1 Tax=Candidatus Desantisbacteria bacterium CG_4_10_14_0_8_um_filter_48_22 TaxID=1974543 RepID=A0A2M7SDG1_9BACT|nr:MAG: 30S ribosomal protein S2 [Candidatus Desantisbacteria bacterium CG_4_10_14_0_8_um_filter_48_22]
MLSINIKQLLEAGVHFGHQTDQWHPKMKQYIFSQRNGIHVIDLQKTMKKFKEAYEFVRDSVAKGNTILFVGTKKQAQEIIKNEATRCNAFFVKERWLGGMLTNFKTIRKNIERLRELETMEKDGRFEVLPNGEVKKLKKEKDALGAVFEGIREMEKLPDIIFMVDLKKEGIAIKEAKKLGIPVVAVVDTNCDPNLVTYCIPGNDDAIRGLNLFVNQIAEAVMEGRGLAKKEEVPPVEQQMEGAVQEEAVAQEKTVAQEEGTVQEKTVAQEEGTVAEGSGGEQDGGNTGGTE